MNFIEIVGIQCYNTVLILIQGYVCHGLNSWLGMENCGTCTRLKNSGFVYLFLALWFFNDHMDNDKKYNNIIL